MKAKSIMAYVLAVVVGAFVASSCGDDEEDLGAPSITISASTMDFESASASQTVQVTATRDWVTSTDADWIAVDPQSGSASADAQAVTITVLENTDVDRSATVKFDIGFDSKTLTVNQVGSKQVTYATIAEVKALYSDAAVNMPEGTLIKGVIVSNAELNNLTSQKTAYVQDETGGIQLYCAASHSLAFGDEVSVDLSGVELTKYAEAYEINALPLDNITVLSSGNAVTATSVSMADFLANKYEGVYIELQDVEVASSDLEKTWVQNDSHTNINMEDKDGNTFIVRSSKYSTFGAETVPQGSGAIRGIATLYSSTIQLVFAQADDYAGLTGERFSSGESTEVKDVTIAEFLAAEVSTTQYYRISGTVTGTINTTYGNFTVTDGTNSVYIYGTSNFSDYSATFAVGGTVTVVGTRYDYYDTAEMTNGKIESYTAPAYTFGVSTTALSAAADATSATFDVTGNVDWTVTSDNEAFTVSPASGTGAGTVTVSFAANTESSTKTANITVTTASENITTKTYTVVLTQAAVSSGSSEDFTSNVTWTAGTNASSDTATINGVSEVSVLKLGTSKKTGTATLTIPSGTSKLTYYGVSWKSKAATVSVEYNGSSVYTQELAANDGATGNTPYTITVADSDKYTIDVASLMGGTTTADLTVTVTTTGTNTRVILFGIKAE